LAVVSPVRCLHLADLHLGWRPASLGGREDERGRERDGLLSKAVEFALDPGNRIDLVLIAGDLFETHRPAPAQVEVVIRQLSRLGTTGIQVVTTPGNHDEITYVDSVYRTTEGRWPGILVKNPMPGKVATLAARGTPVHVYSLAYTGGLTRTEPPLRDFPRHNAPGVHVAVFHGSLGSTGADRSLPIDESGLAQAGYDYVALGHFHQFSERDLRPGAGGPGSGTKAVYPGAVEWRGFADPGTGMFVTANVEPGRTTIERMAVATRPQAVIDLDVTSLVDAQALDNAVAVIAARQGREAIVRIRLAGTSSFAINGEALCERFRDRFYHLEVASDAPLLGRAEIDTWAQEPTIRGEFIRRMTQRIAQEADQEQAAILKRALLYGLRAMEGGAR